MAFNPCGTDVILSLQARLFVREIVASFLLETGLTREVWQKLREEPVPLTETSDFRNILSFVSEYNMMLKNRSYIPNVVHGYLGLQKGNGVTRFLPILTKEDMAVYYHLCGHIGEQVLKKEPDIFGGWRSIPLTKKGTIKRPSRADEEDARAEQGGYFYDTFSDTMWLGQFKNFTQLIRKLTSQASSGLYVATTDIANFYDSIELPQLIRKLRRDTQGKLHEEIELLEVFLSLWDRRTTGYSPSSKGIPQEIISDGSRFLSHYYLQDFDETFKSYCKQNRLRYVRWADDMLIFGSSKKTLEHAIHKASRLLLSEGLNLNANKTRIYSRTDLARNRGLDVLAAIDARNVADFRRKLRSAIDWYQQGNPLRLDTVFRASLGYVFRLSKNAKTFEKNFLFETVDGNPDIISTLNDVQLIRLISIADDPKEMYLKIRTTCLSRPYAGARANFLLLIRKRSKGLVRLGISARLQLSSVNMIMKESGDSEIIRTICVPPAVAAIT